MRALLRAGWRSAATVGRLLRGGFASARAPRRRAALLLALAGAVVADTRGTQDAVANGDTRTIDLFHEHTKESASITFKRDGRYDSAALQQLNWLLRDWRLDEPTKMDPRLFDVVWEARRAVGATGPVHVMSAYRSPGTNAMLRRRSRAVAEHSQHMLGKAMDFWLDDVTIDQIRAVGMRMQRGGVGWYPHAGSPFVHLDVGSVRSWPRMGYGDLARLFPDGRTVHMPASGGPMAGYEEAKAEILARGGSVAGITQVASADETDGGGGGRSLWQMLFGGGGDEDSSYYGLNNGGTGRARPAPAAPRAAPVVVASAGGGEDAGTRTALAYAAARPDASDPLRASLFRSRRDAAAAAPPGRARRVRRSPRHRRRRRRAAPALAPRAARLGGRHHHARGVGAGRSRAAPRERGARPDRRPRPPARALRRRGGARCRRARRPGARRRGALGVGRGRTAGRPALGPGERHPGALRPPRAGRSATRFSGPAVRGLSTGR